MLGAGALGRPRGMGWGEVGGGFRMGNTCTPVADSCQCMAKPIQYCKVKLNKIKKNKNLYILKDKPANEIKMQIANWKNI